MSLRRKVVEKFAKYDKYTPYGVALEEARKRKLIKGKAAKKIRGVITGFVKNIAEAV